MASGHQSISELLRKYQIEIFGVAAAFVAILVFRVLFRKPEPKTKQENTNNTNTTTSSTSSSSKQEASSTGNMESVNISLGELKEGEMKQIDVGETGSFVVVKDKSDVFAFSSKCSHLAAPMKTGYYSNGRVRCPWHGACFSAKTGDIEDFPCVDGIHAFKTSVKGDQVTVNVPTEALKNPKRQIPINAKVTTQETIVILGAGPAGHTAAEELRHQGFEGRIVMIGKEKHLPYDRTKLSKQMEATADKIALRPASFFESAKIELKLGTTVTAVNPSKHTVTLSDNSELTYSKLLIATGGEARTLPVPGKELSNIYPLRVPEDSQAILKNVDGKRVVIVGTSFIGMEAASCLYKKAKSIIAIGMEEVPFERVLGKQIGSGLQKLFESNNIQFRLKRVVKEFKGTNGSVSSVILDDGEELQADLCILGAGIIPSTKILSGLSEIKLEKDGSVICDEYLKASQDIWAAGDIARFPYSGLNGHLMRVEHYAYSQFQGRVAARNMMGQKEACKSVPFFWTNIFGKRFTYAGHAHVYDEVVVDGKIDDFKFAAYFLHKEKVCAVVAVGRDPIASKAAEMFHNGTMLSAADVKGGKFL